MPTSRPSPGPSTRPIAAVLQPLNIRKRAVSELPPESDTSQPVKKSKKDLELSDTEKDCQVKSTENKKRRKKKKKKSPLTAPNVNNEGILPQLRLNGSSKHSDCTIPLPEVPAGIQSGPSTLYRATEPGGCARTPVVWNSEQLVPGLVDKGKTRAVPEQSGHLQKKEATLTPPVSEGTDPMREAQAKIVELEAQLQSQKKLLSQYSDNLSNLQQSLTCQICLDLLYKPFALSPCGHVACYLCLVRWFTSPQSNDNANLVSRVEDIPPLLTSRRATRGTYVRKRKTCPLCRAAVTERPAEIWSIKSMVTSLTKSKLVDLPSLPPSAEAQTSVTDHPSANNDPWRNIFRKPGWGGLLVVHPPPEGTEGGMTVEDMGMWDQEDSVYRCLECMHEVWGVSCTNCGREYPGHATPSNGESGSDSGSDRERDGSFFGRRLRRIFDAYARGHSGDWDDDEDAEMNMLWGPRLHGFNPSDDSMDEDVSESELGSAEDSLNESWDSSDGEIDDNDGDLAAHYQDVIYMQTHVPYWPFRSRRGIPQREGVGGAHIEEVDNVAEEEDPSSDSHSHSEDEDQYEDDSFIDDDDNDTPRYYVSSSHSGGRLGHDEPDSHASGSDSEILHSNDSDGASVSEYHITAIELRNMRLRGATSSVGNFEDEEETDDEDFGEVGRRLRGPPRTRARIRLIDSTDEESDEEL